MPTTLELTAEPRDVLGKKVRRLRRQGIVPANIYGHGSARAIQASARALDHLLAHGGRTGLITIAVDGHSETALLKEIQRDPRSGNLLHIEFQAVSMEEEVTSLVPLRFVGESTAVTKLGGVMTHPRSDVHVTARAGDLPESIEVDLSTLVELNDAINLQRSGGRRRTSDSSTRRRRCWPSSCRRRSRSKKSRKRPKRKLQQPPRPRPKALSAPEAEADTPAAAADAEESAP